MLAILVLRPPATEVARAEGIERVRTARPLVVSGLVALFVFAVVGTVYTADSAAFDGTRWKVASAASEKGWAKSQIRGGFEWTNYHVGTHVKQNARFCVNVVIDPQADLTNERVVAYDYYDSPFNDPVPVVALRSDLACTPRRSP